MAKGHALHLLLEIMTVFQREIIVLSKDIQRIRGNSFLEKTQFKRQLAGFTHTSTSFDIAEDRAPIRIHDDTGQNFKASGIVSTKARAEENIFLKRGW